MCTTCGPQININVPTPVYCNGVGPGCMFILPGTCVNYTGPALSKFGILTNMTLNQALELIDQKASCFALQVGFNADTAITLDLTQDPDNPCLNYLDARLNISADEGNTIESRSDGIYAGGGTPVILDGMTFIQNVNFDYGGAEGFLIWTNVTDSAFPSTAAFSYTNVRSTAYTYQATREVPADELTTETAHLWVNYAIPDTGTGLNGSGLNIIVLHNDEILFSQALVNITAGQTGLIDFGPVPSRGKIELFVSENKFDTNGPDSDQGLLTVGGQFIKGGYFTTSLTLTGGGETRTPNSLDFPSSDVADNSYIDFTTQGFGSPATGGVIQIDWVAAVGDAGGNTRENITVTFTASVDSGLNFTDNIIAGNAYSRTINLTLLQLQNNDFKVHFAPTV